MPWRSQSALPPGFIAPCLPIASNQCKSGPEWVHEIEHDGYRMIARRTDGIPFSEHLDGDGATIFAHACKLGLEGMVSKRRDLPYRPGRCKRLGEGQEPAPAVLRIEDGAW